MRRRANGHHGAENLFAAATEGNTHPVTVVGIHPLRPRTAPPQRQRGLAGYLLLPRPKDLVKGWLVLVTYAVGVLSTGQLHTISLLRALLVVTVVELLVYQARYQWNDVRGFVADQNHPSSGDRGRLPGPLERARAHVAASCAVASLRLAITGALILALPGLHLGAVLGFSVAGVFGVAVAYELVRSLSTGRSGVTPAPVRPGVLLLWCTVGAGYAVRGLIGLALAVDLWRRPVVLIAATVTLWCYGVAFVTSRWAVEVTAFAAIRDGGVVWKADAVQAREHQLALARWIPARVADGVTEAADWAPLRTPLRAPWNVATVVAAAAAAITGRLLAGPCPIWQGVAVAAVGAAAALVASISRRRAVVDAAGALLLWGTLAILHAPRPLLAVLPWVLLMGAHLFFTSRTLAKLSRRNRFAPTLRRVIAAAARIVVGRHTWQAMQRSGDRTEEQRAWVISPHRQN